MAKRDLYPAWRYHRTLEPLICKDAAHDKELGDEWEETPAAFENPKPPVKKEEKKSAAPKKAN